MSYRSSTGSSGFRAKPNLAPLLGAPIVPIENTWYTGYTGNAYSSQINDQYSNQFNNHFEASKAPKGQFLNPMYTARAATRATARLVPLAHGRRRDPNNRDRTDYSITPSIAPPPDPAMEFYQTINDLMRSAKALEIRWLEFRDPGSRKENTQAAFDERELRSEELPSMLVPPHQCNFLPGNHAHAFRMKVVALTPSIISSPFLNIFLWQFNTPVQSLARHVRV